MDVIRPGRDDPKWSKEFECRGKDGMGRSVGCGALLRVTKRDLFTENVHDIGGPRDEVRFKCRCCGTTVTINEPFVELPTKENWRPPPKWL